MAKEYSLSISPMGWKLPFYFAILFHVLLLSSAIVVPKYIKSSTKLPEFTSVNLINIAEVLPPASLPKFTSSPPPAAIPITKISPAKTAPIAEIAEVAPVVVAPAKAISLKPLKRKVKKKLPAGRSTAEIERKIALARQQLLEKRSQQLQKEAKTQKAIADAEAKIANEALAALKQSLRADAAAATAKQTSNRTGGSGGRSNALEAQYFSSIFGHLHQYWSVPEIKRGDAQLQATVVITIAQNGRIIDYKFEKRSGDRIFDQFVSRTIQDANPLPAIPRALKKQQLTIGLHFKPGKIL